jgi:hypothetical protein
MKWQIVSPEIGVECSFRLRGRAAFATMLVNAHFGAIHELASEGLVSLVSILRGRAARTSAVTLTGVWALSFLDDLEHGRARSSPHTVSITTIHHALNLIATLFAWFSIAGFLFVILFLFQGERGTATAQSSRREQ